MHYIDGGNVMAGGTAGIAPHGRGIFNAEPINGFNINGIGELDTHAGNQDIGTIGVFVKINCAGAGSALFVPEFKPVNQPAVIYAQLAHQLMNHRAERRGLKVKNATPGQAHLTALMELIAPGVATEIIMIFKDQDA